MQFCNLDGYFLHSTSQAGILSIPDPELHRSKSLFAARSSWVNFSPMNTLACPARSTQSRWENQSMCECCWPGQKGQRFPRKTLAEIGTACTEDDPLLFHINGAWVVLPAVTMGVSCPLGVSCVVCARERKFFFLTSLNKSFVIDQPCYDKMFDGYWSHPLRKKEIGQYPVIFSDGTSLANLKGLLSYKKNLKFPFTFIDREEVQDKKTSEKTRSIPSHFYLKLGQ